MVKKCKMKACWIKIKTIYILLIKVRYITLVCFSLVIIGVSQFPSIIHLVVHFERSNMNHYGRVESFRWYPYLFS